MKVKKMLIRAIALSSIACVSTNANTIKFQVPACTSDDLLDEFERYIIDQDNEGMMQLISNGDCIVLMAGDSVSLISRGFSTSTVRVAGVKYYLASEAID